MSIKAHIVTLTAELSPREEIEGCANLDFNGELMLEITRGDITGEWCVTNAMNGYGKNCFEQYKDCLVIVKHER